MVRLTISHTVLNFPADGAISNLIDYTESEIDTPASAAISLSVIGDLLLGAVFYDTYVRTRMSDCCMNLQLYC